MKNLLFIDCSCPICTVTSLLDFNWQSAILVKKKKRIVSSSNYLEKKEKRQSLLSLSLEIQSKRFLSKFKTHCKREEIMIYYKVDLIQDKADYKITR